MQLIYKIFPLLRDAFFEWRLIRQKVRYLQIDSIRSWMCLHGSEPMFRISLAGEKRCWDKKNKSSTVLFLKEKTQRARTNHQIVRPANPGHSSTTGMILGIWNAVRRARWNQIKTKLRSVRLRAHNLLLSMNFDRYKGNKRRRNRERGEKKGGDILCLRRELFLWAARQQNLKKLLPWGRKKEL